MTWGNMMNSTFLDKEEICTLTGRIHKALQIRALKSMGVPFFINDIGRPVVTRSAIEGKTLAAKPEKKAWVPNVLKSG